jgi:hypothetical protein
VQLNEVNDGYSAGRDRPPIVLGRAGSWSSLNASKPVMRQLARHEWLVAVLGGLGFDLSFPLTDPAAHESEQRITAGIG